MTVAAPTSRSGITPTQFQPGAWTARHVAAHLNAGIPPRVVRQMIQGWPQPSTYTQEHRAAHQTVWPAPLPPLDTFPTHHWVALQGTPDYPLTLEDTPHPPLLLYGRGNKQLLQTKGLALLAGDHLSTYGEGVLAGAITNPDIPYVILLEGASAAHTVTLAAEQSVPVVGVVATGPDRLTHEQENLATQILTGGGTIITEQPFGTTDTNAPNRTPAPYTARLSAATRIIAGLAFAAVFVEGPGRCVGMHGIWNALELGRPIFVARPRSIPPQAQLQGPRALAAPTPRTSETLIAMGAPAAVADRYRNNPDPLAAGIARDREELALLIRAAQLFQPTPET